MGNDLIILSLVIWYLRFQNNNFHCGKMTRQNPSSRSRQSVSGHIISLHVQYVYSNIVYAKRDSTLTFKSLLFTYPINGIGKIHSKKNIAFGLNKVNYQQNSYDNLSPLQIDIFDIFWPAYMWKNFKNFWVGTVGNA